jgi:twitching motility protein PilU
LRAIIAQQLIRSPDGKSRHPAIEILVNTPRAADLIRKGEVHKLKELMKHSREQGMQTFDQCLFDLYRAGKIAYEDALRAADSQNEVRLMIKLAEDGKDPGAAASEAMTLIEEDEQT